MSTDEAQFERQLKTGFLPAERTFQGVCSAAKALRCAAPPAESDLGIMILGILAVFANSAPHYSFIFKGRDAFRNVLGIPTVSSEAPCALRAAQNQKDRRRTRKLSICNILTLQDLLT